MIQECRIEIKEADKKNKIAVIRVSGHSGNETANILKRKSVLISLTGPVSFCGMGKNTYKKEIQKEKAESGITLKCFFGALKLLNPKNIWITVKITYTYSTKGHFRRIFCIEETTPICLATEWPAKEGNAFLTRRTAESTNWPRWSSSRYWIFSNLWNWRTIFEKALQGSAIDWNLKWTVTYLLSIQYKFKTIWMFSF